jgi:hypothetical protein
MCDPFVSGLPEVHDWKLLHAIHLEARTTVRCSYTIEHLGFSKFVHLVHSESSVVGNIVPKTPVRVIAEEKGQWNEKTTIPIPLK